MNPDLDQMALPSKLLEQLPVALHKIWVKRVENADCALRSEFHQERFKATAVLNWGSRKPISKIAGVSE